MNIIPKARGTKIPIYAQRIFFSCDARNTGGRDALISDLLSVDARMNYVVLFLEVPDHDIDRELLQNELLGTQALILWVTDEMLRGMVDGRYPEEYLLAREFRLPVLPVASDASLFPRFTELAGAIHGIALTDVNYRTKLKTQLEAMLFSDELIREINDKAFTAKVFLSYRKMDIQIARSFMSTLHGMSEFEAVSVWYDNFLTAGRIFDEEIRESIDNCDAFTLLVTPNLLKKNNEGRDNYVVSSEYPYARGKGKPIVPVEAVRTNPEDFISLFPGVKTIPMGNPGALDATFREKLGDSASMKQMDSERAYYLGMAYMKGIGLERDINRAIKLLTRTAEGDDLLALTAAKTLLSHVYQDQAAISVDKEQAVKWRLKVVSLSERLTGPDSPETAEAYNLLGVLHEQMEDYPASVKAYKKAFAIYEKNPENLSLEIAGAYNNAAAVQYKMGELTEALAFTKKSLELFEQELGEGDAETAGVYVNMGTVYMLMENKSMAWQCFTRAVHIYEETLGTYHYEYASAYYNLALLSAQMGNPVAAKDFYHTAANVYETSLGQYHPHTADAYQGAAVSCLHNGDIDAALHYFLIELTIRSHSRNITSNEPKAVFHKVRKLYHTALDFTRPFVSWLADKLNGLCAKESLDTSGAFLCAAFCFHEADDRQNASAMLTAAAKVSEKVYGPQHALTEAIYECL